MKNDAHHEISPGIAICISGPSGVGKGTVIRELMTINADFWLSVSMTTREPRPGEVDGVSYLFTTPEKFRDLQSAGGFLETDEYCGNFYGTPLAPVQQHLEMGHHVIFDVTVPGTFAIKESLPSAVSVFLLPPDLQSLIQRLRHRGTETEEKLIKRFRKAKEEIRSAKAFDYVVINDDEKKAAERIYSIVESSRFLAERQEKQIEKLLREDISI